MGLHSLYRTYFRPKATSTEIVRVSHYFICFWAVWAGCWATIVRPVRSHRRRCLYRTLPAASQSEHRPRLAVLRPVRPLLGTVSCIYTRSSYSTLKGRRTQPRSHPDRAHRHLVWTHPRWGIHWLHFRRHSRNACVDDRLPEDIRYVPSTTSSHASVPEVNGFNDFGTFGRGDQRDEFGRAVLRRVQRLDGAAVFRCSHRSRIVGE